MFATWTEDRTSTLARLWREGLSASVIAKTLGGVTRNAVIGKVHRLGLSGRGAPSAPTRSARTPAKRTPRSARPAPPHRSSAPAPAPSAPPAEGPGLVSDLRHLGAHACRWPIGDPKAPGFSFCGRPAEGVYCAGHAQTAYRPGRAKPLHREEEVRQFLRGLAA